MLVAALAAVPVLALAAFGVVRLTSDDTPDAVAAASGDILNPHPAAGPFTADETELEDCTPESDDRRRCLEQAFGNVAYRTSGKQALALVAEQQASDADVAGGCHRIVHAVGAAVLAREDGNAGKALVDGDSTCWSGFYHGLLERALAPARSAEELGSLITTLCDPSGQNWPPFTHYQCLHGIGHGLMLRTGNALDASLGLCTRLADQWSRQSCDGGVFMESFSPSLDLKPPPFDAKDPLAPCPTVADTHKLYCYLQVADNLVRGTGYDWSRIAAACRTERDASWRAICFQGYGRQASGNNYGRPRAVAELCAVAGADGEPECVYGAVRDIASNAASGAPAATFCRVLDSAEQASLLRGGRNDPGEPRDRRRDTASAMCRAERRIHRVVRARRRPAGLTSRRGGYARRMESQLLAWFEATARDLPWRRTRDPYSVLVSEVMLQQTQVERVVPRYERWLARWPTVESLAAATTADVIVEWQGLGYNRRALALHRAARRVAEHGWPGDLTELPGVGPYTAAAVRNFACRRRRAPS